jgi:hypothetical protein
MIRLAGEHPPAVPHLDEYTEAAELAVVMAHVVGFEVEVAVPTPAADHVDR